MLAYAGELLPTTKTG